MLGNTGGSPLYSPHTTTLLGQTDSRQGFLSLGSSRSLSLRCTSTVAFVVVATLYIIVTFFVAEPTASTAFLTSVQNLGGYSAIVKTTPSAPSSSSAVSSGAGQSGTSSITGAIPKSASGLPIANYALVIDAGSSGSRLYVYQYKLPEILSTKNGRDRLGNPAAPPADPHADLLHVALAVDSQGRPVIKKQEPGLSAFADRPGEAFSAIKSLLDFARSHIPPQLYSRTPIYLLATAGLRLIPVEKKDAILASLRMHLKSESDAGSFLFDNDQHATVITGEQEGLYGWIALNYVLNRFGDLNTTYASGGLDPHTYSVIPTKSHHPWYTPLPQSPAEQAATALAPPHTVGLVELGGGSAQIAFEADDDNASEGAVSNPPNGPIHPDEFIFQLDLDLTRCGSTVKKLSKAEFDEQRREVRSKAVTTAAAVTPILSPNAQALTPVVPSRKRLEQQKGKGLGLGGHVYNVYSASFLGYGANSARDRYVASLIEARQKILENNLYSGKPGMNRVILDPCLLKHQRQIVSSKKTWGRPLPPAAAGSSVPAPDAGQVNLESGEFLLEGSGNWGECRRNLVAVLDKELPCPYRCPFGGKYQPQLTQQILSQQFYAFSEYWYTTRDVLGMDPAKFTSEEFLRVSHELCSAESSDFHKVFEKFQKGMYAINANEDRIRQQCFKSAWLDVILFQGHEFPRNLRPNSILPISSIEGTEVQWTLGALIAMTTEKLKRDPALCRRMATQDGLSDVRLKIVSDMLGQSEGADANAALPPALAAPPSTDAEGQPTLVPSSARYAKRGYAPEGTSAVYTDAQIQSLELALRERRKGLFTRIAEYLYTWINPYSTTSAAVAAGATGAVTVVKSAPSGSTGVSTTAPATPAPKAGPAGYAVVLNGGETVSTWLWVLVFAGVLLATRLSYLVSSGPLDLLTMSPAAARLIPGRSGSSSTSSSSSRPSSASFSQMTPTFNRVYSPSPVTPNSMVVPDNFIAALNEP